MTYIIPSPLQPTHTQTNRNDVSGSLYVTRNINLDSEAYLKLSGGAYAVMTEDDDSEFDSAMAMNQGDGTIYVTGRDVFRGDINGTTLNNLSTDTNVPTPSVEDDTIYFNGTQVVSDNTTIAYLSAATTWTDIGGLSISGNSPTSLAVFDAQNSLLIGHGNRVDMVDTTWTLTQTLVLPDEFKVSSMWAVGNVAYIATRHDVAGEAKLFLWDGTGAAAQAAYGVENYEIASVKGYQSSVAGFSSDGRLQRFNGGGFTELAVLPVFTSDVEYGDPGNDYSTISNRGMIVDGDLIYLTASSVTESGWRRWEPYFQGGVWCFDPNVGLYHRHAPSFTKVTSETLTSSTAINFTTNTLTGAAAPATGTPVQYSDATGAVSPLKRVTTYYAINVSSTEFQLALSNADATAGTAIDLTETTSGTIDLYYYAPFDYGQTYIRSRQAIVKAIGTSRDDEFAGRFAFSGYVGGDAGVEKNALCTYLPHLPNRGYAILPKLYSNTSASSYSAVEVEHLPLGPDDKIVVRYKVEDTKNFPLRFDELSDDDVQGTWTSTTTFTTLHDLSAVEAGYMVELCKGNGSGVVDTISSISESSGTYTVTLKNGFDFAVNGEKFYFIVDTFLEAATITANSKNSRLKVEDSGPFLQLRVDMDGIDVTIKDITINDKPYRSLV